jgi:hypothetical protein
MAKIKHINASSIPAYQILSSLTAKDSNLVLISRDVYNILAQLRREQLGIKSLTKWLLDVYYLFLKSEVLALLTN